MVSSYMNNEILRFDHSATLIPSTTDVADFSGLEINIVMYFTNMSTEVGLSHPQYMTTAYRFASDPMNVSTRRHKIGKASTVERRVDGPTCERCCLVIGVSIVITGQSCCRWRCSSAYCFSCIWRTIRIKRGSGNRGPIIVVVVCATRQSRSMRARKDIIIVRCIIAIATLPEANVRSNWQPTWNYWLGTS